MDHVVKRGETLRTIAEEYGASLTDFIAANPDIDPDRIFPGQRLTIPGAGTPTPSPSSSARPTTTKREERRAERGEEVKAQRKAVPRKAEQTEREAARRSERRTGRNAGPAPTTVEYAVQSGDTLKSIASNFGVSLRALLDANRSIENPDVIKRGQVVLVPAADRKVETSRSPARPEPAASRSGTTRDWTNESVDERIRYAMERLVAYGYPPKGAAGIVGNLYYESGVLPNRIEGSKPETPMRSQNFDGVLTDFSAEEVMRRDAEKRRGPRQGGIGLAQWTWWTRRRRLFDHEYEGSVLGADILFDMDAQIDFLVTEMRSATYRDVEGVVSDPKVSVHDAADAVLYDFEKPGSIIGDDGAKLPRSHASVQRVFGQRRELADRAFAVYESARSG